MDYRGSKSDFKLKTIFKLKTVKEQRVDGSYFINNNKNQKLMQLRCTLMGFERNYQISNPSKQNFYKKSSNYLQKCLA